MAGQDIVQNLIAELGQSQSARMPVALDSHYADVDERTTADYHEFLRSFSEYIHYYRDDSTTPLADWSNFFPFNAGEAAEWLSNLNASTPAHMALLNTFFELYQHPQQLMNTITGRHLDFYYQDILRLQKKPAVADKAHLLIELKKNASAIELNENHIFSGGKDNTGVELLYKPVTSTVINTAKVASLRSLYVNKDGNGSVHYAPIANSTDGLGGELPEDAPKWLGFGYDDLPYAETGFALSSPVLRLQEGSRKITVTLTLGNITANTLAGANLNDAFTIYLSGAKSWLGPFTVTPTLSGNTLTFLIEVTTDLDSVVNYDQAIHGYHFSSDAPIMQVFLNTDSTTIGYNQFKGVSLKKAKITVDVSGVTSLQLESDDGSLNPAKAFMPFGPQGKKGSRFLIGYPEALSKKLSQVSLQIEWKDAPTNFSTHYSNYGVSVSNSYFKVSSSFNDGGSWSLSQTGTPLFSSSNASSAKTITFSTASTSNSSHSGLGGIAYALNLYASSWAKYSLGKLLLKSPVYKAAAVTPANPTAGFITLQLEKSFLHDTYRQQYVKNAMEFSSGAVDTLVLINEPYTPVIQSIALSYKAYSDNVNMETNSLTAFSNNDCHFYHLAYFGQMRDHAYQRNLFSYVADKTVSLLPKYTNQGELLIGLENLHAGDSVSVLFQMAEGSADPELDQEAITWSVLSDNYWKTLKPTEVIFDATNQLLTSGLIKFVIPAEATTDNTLLPAGYIWLKAGVAGEVTALCQLIDVAANAIEVMFSDQGNDTQHLTSALPAKTIGKLKTSLAEVKKVSQPYASFGGAVVEQTDDFNTRVAERLRHKDRSQTAWDIERLILAEFPNIHRVKAIPHSKPGSWLSPGHAMVIVIPDLTNQNAIDPLQPKVDSNTLSAVRSLLKSRSGMQVQYHVANPSYQKIQLDFKVAFKTGYEFNYYSGELEKTIIEYLSPWAFGDGSDITFGGKMYKSVLLDMIEEISYVDFLTDFKLYSFVNEGDTLQDVNEVMPLTPDAILVSANTHIIKEYS